MSKIATAFLLSASVACVSSTARAHVSPTAPLFQPQMSLDWPVTMQVTGAVLLGTLVGN